MQWNYGESETDWYLGSDYFLNCLEDWFQIQGESNSSLIKRVISNQEEQCMCAIRYGFWSVVLTCLRFGNMVQLKLRFLPLYKLSLETTDVLA